MPVIKVGAFDLDFTDTGSGPAVVLVHSSASGHRQWQRLVEALQSRYRLLAINLLGYGKTSSWPGTRPLTAADQAELIAQRHPNWRGSPSPSSAIRSEARSRSKLRLCSPVASGY